MWGNHISKSMKDKIGKACIAHSFATIVVIDDKNIIQYINKSPFSHTSELIGKNALNVCPEPDRFFRIVEAVRKVNKAHTEERIIGDDTGRLSWVRVIPLIKKWILLIIYPYKGVPKELSAREKEIKRLSDEGMRDKDIAQALHISLATVASHKKSYRKKLSK